MECHTDLQVWWPTCISMNQPILSLSVSLWKVCFTKFVFRLTKQHGKVRPSLLTGTSSRSYDLKETFLVPNSLVCWKVFFQTVLLLWIKFIRTSALFLHGANSPLGCKKSLSNLVNYFVQLILLQHVSTTWSGERYLHYVSWIMFYVISIGIWSTEKWLSWIYAI